jgi:hypothetical protein
LDDPAGFPSSPSDKAALAVSALFFQQTFHRLQEIAGFVHETIAKGLRGPAFAGRSEPCPDVYVMKATARRSATGADDPSMSVQRRARLDLRNAMISPTASGKRLKLGCLQGLPSF